jgi:selenocysteine lyase/cysteine desulfurase
MNVCRLFIQTRRPGPSKVADALAIVEQMGLLESGTMIRMGPVHYNTPDEIERFGEVLKQIA